MIDEQKQSTKLIKSGHGHSTIPHTVSVPPHRGSTILFPTYEQFKAKKKTLIYGRLGTETHHAFEESIKALDHAQYAHIASSGLSAVTISILTAVNAGDHILIPDNAYDPVRGFCTGFLKRMKVDVDFYNPVSTDDIELLVRPNTKAILIEPPGSLTFEVPNLPALLKLAQSKNIKTLIDNTWSSGICLSPLVIGADICITAATKYISGHSDCLLGTISTNNKALYKSIRQCAQQIGDNPSVDDIFLAHRGIRTLPARMKIHERNGLALANWFEQRDEVEAVFHPALASHPQFEHFREVFAGSSGLFAVQLKHASEVSMAAFCNTMQLFGMGYSWGGYESLLIPVDPTPYRSATNWPYKGQLIRIHAGLEDYDDLVHDLDCAFKAYREAA